MTVSERKGNQNFISREDKLACHRASGVAALRFKPYFLPLVNSKGPLSGLSLICAFMDN